MKRAVKPPYLFHTVCVLSVFGAMIVLTGCHKSDSAPAAPSAPSAPGAPKTTGGTSAIRPALPSNVQVGPPK